MSPWQHLDPAITRSLASSKRQPVAAFGPIYIVDLAKSVPRLPNGSSAAEIFRHAADICPGSDPDRHCPPLGSHDPRCQV
jgi:hypothetical protein